MICAFLLEAHNKFKLRFGKYLPLLPWLPDELKCWHGKFLLRMVNPKILACMINGDKRCEIINVGQWISWGIQGRIVVAIKQGTGSNPELESKIPMEYRNVEVNHANDGMIVGLAIIDRLHDGPISPKQAAWCQDQKCWKEAYGSDTNGVHRFTWVLQFHKPFKCDKESSTLEVDL